MNHIIVVQCKNNIEGKPKRRVIESNPDARPTAPIYAVWLLSTEKMLKIAKMNQFNKFKARSFLHKAGKKTIEIESFMKKLDALRYSNHIAKDLRNKGLSVVQQKEVGPRRIYVIKLKKDALKEDEFSRVNPRRIESLPCLYVGQTSNTIESRYLQHLNDRVLGSKWVRRYDDGLAFEFFDMDREFQTELEALEEEERLGLELRKKGYATIWG